MLADKIVLLADDNPTNRLLVKRMLIQQGCQVTCAENGDEALAQVTDAKADFDLVLMCQAPAATQRVCRQRNRDETVSIHRHSVTG